MAYNKQDFRFELLDSDITVSDDDNISINREKITYTRDEIYFGVDFDDFFIDLQDYCRENSLPLLEHCISLDLEEFIRDQLFIFLERENNSQ